ncbi:response regulator [Pseudactinotalea sp.]|uniref:response regulator n=1 Tax=Pseudactinotalea sp. TaxID=1926260 RepID=UPI003B3B70DD
MVADDQALVCAGFASILDAATDLRVVGTAGDGAELLELVARTEPDIAVVDVRMPVMDGILATERITADHPATKVLILTTFDLDEYVYDALRAGASGFLLKDTTAVRLVEAVRLVADGSMLLGPTVTRRLVSDFTHREVEDVPGVAELTPREREVLVAIGSGLSNQEIAAELWIAEATVKSHVGELLRKTGSRDRVQLVLAAFRAGLVSLD